MGEVNGKQVVVVRHAIAEEEQAAQPDALRPLSAKGREKMAKGARGLKNIFPEAKVIAHSPLLRALQTAEILASCYPDAALREVAVLAPGKGAVAINQWLQHQPVSRLILVGHEPDLSHWLCALLSGRRNSFVELGKGSACLVEVPPQKGNARLEWLLTPRLLRGMQE